MRALLFLAALLLAVPADAAPPSGSVQPDDIGAMADEMDKYRIFLGQLTEAQQPLHGRLTELQQRWGALDWGGDLAASAAAFHTYSAEVAALVETTNRRVAALATPTVTNMALPEDLTPAQMRDAVLEVNRNVAALVAGFGPVLDAAVRSDTAGVEAANNQLIDGGRTLLRSQLLMMRASLASTERSDSGWDIQNIELLLTEGMMRGLESFARLLRDEADPSFASDMRSLATRSRTSGTDGARKNEAEIVDMREALAEAKADQDAGRERLAHLALVTGQTGRSIFALAGVLADEFDRAASMPAAGNRLAGLSLFMNGMRALRLELDRHSVAMVEAVNR